MLRRLSLAFGGLATAPLASGLLSGCRTPETGDLASYTYSTLNDDQQRLISALVDQILPETDTPGASEAGVPQFIDTMLTDWYAPEERDEFLAALGAVDARGSGPFADLDDAAQAEMVAAMDAEAFANQPADEVPDEDVAEVAVEGTSAMKEEAENEVAGMQGDLGESMDRDTEAATELSTGEGTASIGGETTDVPFYRQLKELTVAGYYTSEVGATQELQWIAAPNRYDADVSLSEVGRAWA